MRPSIAELRSRVHPPGLLERRSGEHWAGRWYMRRVSLRVTRLLVATRVTPNALTVLMILVGLAAATALAWPWWATALSAAVLVQAYLLLDCVDGEVARWRATTSAAGVYLDRLGHHVVEAALVIGLGFRAAGGPGLPGDGWVVLGAVTALLVVIGKLESDLVIVARATAELDATVERDASSRHAGVRGLRRLVAAVTVHRLIGAVELSLVVLVAAVVDVLRGDLAATRAVLSATGVVALVVAVGHPVTILTSERLK